MGASEFLDEIYPAKTRRMGLLYVEDCVILTSTVFDWSTCVTDRQTDKQTDGQTDKIAIAYSALINVFVIIRSLTNRCTNHHCKSLVFNAAFLASIFTARSMRGMLR